MKNSAIYILAFLLLGLGFNTLAQTPVGNTSCPLYVPKAFTPNGDNLNETFLIRVSEECLVENYRINIFDRWGQIVFEGNSLAEANAWDGKIKGTDARPGVYMYQISIKMVHQSEPSNKAEIKNKQGSLVLLR
jgi:gliding motility-associated-like protein